MAPKIIPNLNQILFNGVNKFDFIKPKIKKTKETIMAQILIWSPCKRGHRLITIKTKKKTKPKLLFEPIFILEFEDILLFFLISCFIKKS